MLERRFLPFLRHHLWPATASVMALVMLAACVPQGSSSGGRRSVASSSNQSSSGTTSACNPALASCASSSTTTTTTETITTGPTVELRHVVDPQDGTYAKKATIPRNFSGVLYIAGLNVSTLTDRHIGVRFKFGQALESVVVEATVARGQGITPATEVELLALDFSAKPFAALKLLYDLYDYNSYDLTTDSPVSDPRNRKLYCRGLDLAYDPSFSGTTCSTSSSTCLYAYAKVLDKGLVSAATGYAVSPTQPQIDLALGGYGSDPVANKATKCLPDDGSTANALGGAIGVFPANSIIAGYNYVGPYRALNYANWKITGPAVVGPNGIFKALHPLSGLSNVTSTSVQYGIKSLLFPLFGKMSLRAGVDHLSASLPDAVKTVASLGTAGTTEWMDGCNIRVSKYDADLNQGIGACNVTATLEVVEINPSTLAVKNVIATSSSVKIQIIRDSATNSSGEDVLYSNFKTCTSKYNCAASECCYNKRCWSDELVSMCVEDAVNSGERPAGEACTSDYQCSSLCCSSSGTCTVHDTSLATPVYCSKVPGEKCVAKEYCRQENVVTCKIVKTGNDNSTGKQTCALRCYNSMQFGDCKGGSCIPPKQPTVPAFDVNNPDCSTAVDAPTT